MTRSTSLSNKFLHQPFGIWEWNGSITNFPGEGPEAPSAGKGLCHLLAWTHCYHPAKHATATPAVGAAARVFLVPMTAAQKHWRSHRLLGTSNTLFFLFEWKAFKLKASTAVCKDEIPHFLIKHWHFPLNKPRTAAAVSLILCFVLEADL